MSPPVSSLEFFKNCTYSIDLKVIRNVYVRAPVEIFSMSLTADAFRGECKILT